MSTPNDIEVGPQSNSTDLADFSHAIAANLYSIKRLSPSNRFYALTGKIDDSSAMPPPKYSGSTNTLGGFIRKAQRTLLNTPWQIIQVSYENYNFEFTPFHRLVLPPGLLTTYCLLYSVSA